MKTERKIYVIRGGLLLIGLLSADVEWARAGAGGDVVRVNKHYDLTALREYRRDRHIDVVTDPEAITLTPFSLLFDELGYSETGVFHQGLSDRVWAKKEFLIDRPRARWAQIYFLRGSDQTTVTLNGEKLEVGSPQDWAYGGWGVVDVPPELIQKGINEVVFSGRGDLHVTVNRWPNRSARSLDGGATWDYDHLGSHGGYNGEYTVRLGLGAYPEEGLIWSDEIPLASLADPGPIWPAVEGRAIRLQADRQTPDQTQVRFEVRTGGTPSYEPTTWEAWSPLPLNTWKRIPPDHRYVQWRAILGTKDPLRTPRLHSVTVAAELKIVAPSDPQRLRMVRWRNQKIVRSSYHFVYQGPSPRLETLRRKYGIDQVVAGKESELAQFVALRDWTRHQWDHGWEDGEYGTCALHDALFILDLAPRNKVSAFCSHYAFVFNQCALSLGHNARVVCARAHAYSEVWSNQYQKWVVMDPGPDPDDEKKLNFHFEVDGIPLDSLQLHERLLARDWEEVRIVTSDPEDDWKPEDPAQFMKRYTYVRLMPRNNQLDSVVPGDLNVKGWPSIATWIAWRDGAVCALRRDQPYTTNRRGDLYWTLNQVALFPYLTEDPGMLRLELDTQTPNFRAYQVRLNGGEWTPCASSFEWTLAPGRNRLEVRTVNAFDVPGIESRMEVEYVR